ncbi:hypothetical protein OG785_35095 [Streptomyces sp. NBC_00006]|uniref:hypothetical protein n=1 Tax=unclassified Streptomyces TaxID=2593676 RepID=UPI002250113E|nr:MULTISPECIES: hypothetical protein [unclassified Streptomyces]MCX5535771.1 hypothetical protein [Streptomyces sp. NBC_00006]
MNHPARQSRSTPRNEVLPTTIWLPAPDEEHTTPRSGAVLPSWALDRIRTELAQRPGRTPAPLIKLDIRDTDPGMDARTRTTTYACTDDFTGVPPVLLAELHPDALSTGSDPAAEGDALEDGWPSFFHRAHRLLRNDGLLLLATRQRRDDGRLTDPIGSLITSARTAGFRYLQHIVFAYARPDGTHIAPAPPPDASPGVTHADLIILTAIKQA